MHYPQCNGDNEGDLEITALDVAGATTLYGGPSTCGVEPPGNALLAALLVAID